MYIGLFWHIYRSRLTCTWTLFTRHLKSWTTIGDNFLYIGFNVHHRNPPPSHGGGFSFGMFRFQEAEKREEEEGKEKKRRRNWMGGGPTIKVFSKFFLSIFFSSRLLKLKHARKETSKEGGPGEGSSDDQGVFQHVLYTQHVNWSLWTYV